MKKLLLTIAIATTAFACNNKNYTINGVVADSTLNGKKVYMINVSTQETIDSTEVLDNKFTFTGNIDSAMVVRVAVGRIGATVIPESKTINVLLSGDGPVIGGTALNDELNKFKEEEKQIWDRLHTEFNEFMINNDQENMKIVQGKFTSEMGALTQKYFEANKTNPIGALMLYTKVAEASSVAEIDSLTNLVGDKAKTFGPIVKIRDAKFAAENTGVGKMFVDFNGINTEGNPVKLSDYVGKGNYVLVDFWASWCGPCRAAMPGLKELYSTYKDSGLVIVGANVWDKKEAFEKALVELELPWAQICNFENNTPTDLYGVMGIPQIILFNPDGTIAARDLHGEVLQKTVADVYAK